MTRGPALILSFGPIRADPARRVGEAIFFRGNE